MALFDFRPQALDQMIGLSGVMGRVGRAVRDEARRNVSPELKGNREAHPERAIVSVTGADTRGPYVDIGYDKKHPGFYLWWWEVGTQDHAAKPHLRPALRPGLLSD